MAACVAATLAVAEAAPMWSQQQSPDWGLDRIDQRQLPLDGRFEYGATGAGVNVYIIDSGVRVTHQDFAGRIHVVGNFVRNTNPTPADDVSDCAASIDGHGTHQASYAAGSRFGVAKGADIWVLKAAGGAACEPDMKAVVDAVEWITTNGKRPGVVNISWRPDNVAAVNQAVSQSIHAGFVFTLSAGSAGAVTAYWGDRLPTEAIIVAGTDRLDRAQRTDYGPALTLFAPAIETSSAGSGGDSDLHISGIGRGADCEQGCDSYAAPRAAGVVAVHLERHPNASPADVRAAIVGGATAGVVRNAGRSPNRMLYAPPSGFGAASR